MRSRNGDLRPRRKNPHRSSNLSSALRETRGSAQDGRSGFEHAASPGEWRHFAMTIAKRLYLGFGVILGILGLLFIFNIVPGFREQPPRKDATPALENVHTIESVPYEIMLNAPPMDNFLLRGDPRGH